MDRSVSLSLGRVCLLIAVICFVLAFFGIAIDGHSLLDLGLAIFALAFLV